MESSENDDMMDAENKSCEVCSQVFDNEERIPRTLPCSHTLCSKCISDNITEGTLLCPICSSEHQTNTPDDYPVNNELQNMTNGEAEEAQESNEETKEQSQEETTEETKDESQEETREQSQEETQELSQEETQEATIDTITQNFSDTLEVDATRGSPKKLNAEGRKSRLSNKSKTKLIKRDTSAPHIPDGNDALNAATDSSTGISKKLNSMKADLSDSMESIKERSQEVTTQLYQYQTLMKQWKEDHEKIIEQYLTIVQEHEEIVKFIDGEYNRVSDTIKTGEEEMNKMKMAEEKLNAATTAQETVPAFGEAAQRYDVVDTWTQEAQKNFPETDLIRKSVMLKERSQNVLQVMSTAKEQELTSAKLVRKSKTHRRNKGSSSSTDIDTSSSSATGNESSEEISLWSPVLSVQEKVTRAVNSASSSNSDPAKSPQIDQGVQAQMGPLITLNSLRNVTPLVRQIIESGRVYAVQEHKRQKRFARISFHKNQLCLHALFRQSIPSDAFVLQHPDVMSLLDPSSRLAFLTLAAGKSTLGRLYIRLAPETNRAHNFALLCTGELGPSYANTNIIRVVDRGKNGEYIDCGDYENNNGTGGKGLMVGAGNEWGGVYKRPCLAGAVDGWWGAGDAKAAQFGITTRDDPGCSLPAAFGMVESGLHILTDAIALYPTIRDVKIGDCGLVLPY